MGLMDRQGQTQMKQQTNLKDLEIRDLMVAEELKITVRTTLLLIMHIVMEAAELAVEAAVVEEDMEETAGMEGRVMVELLLLALMLVDRPPLLEIQIWEPMAAEEVEEVGMELMEEMGETPLLVPIIWQAEAAEAAEVGMEETVVMGAEI